MYRSFETRIPVLSLNLATAAIALLVSSEALALPRYIQNPGTLFHFKQLRDFSALMNPRDTDVNVGGVVKYQNLPTAASGATRVVYQKMPFSAEPWFAAVPNPENSPQFSANTLSAITQGHLHCAPTSVAMLMSWWATNGVGLAALGPQMGQTPTQYIDEIAGYLDTNDQNAAINNGDMRGHVGTFVSQYEPGIQNFVIARLPGAGEPRATVTFAAWNTSTYRGSVATARKPILLSYRNPGTQIGHAMVGYGYANSPSGTLVLARDPARSSPGISVPASHFVRAVSVDIAKQRPDGRKSPGDEITISDVDSPPLEDALLITVDFPGVELIPEFEFVPTLPWWGMTLLALTLLASTAVVMRRLWPS